ncbi:MAG: GTPase Era [Chloroflexi bacterium]|nr:GTPase Era [Chloroflexota bacterium]
MTPLFGAVPAGHRSGFVAIIGKPNVGKSTLLNAWVGLKIAAVSPKPQTTRNRLLGILTQPDAQIIFIDTPGIHQPRSKLGDFMVNTALKALREADVVLFLVDGSEPPSKADAAIAGYCSEVQAPVILVLNKADLASRPDNYQAYMALGSWHSSAVISALKGIGCAELLQSVTQLLPLGPRFYPEEQTTDQQERFIAAELVREQALRQLEQEVPHSIAVVVDEYKERENGDIFISATILCEKDSHKGIIIGKGGAKLKQIGKQARFELEKLVQARVYLELWVKVRANWREDEHILRDLGYVMPAEE